MNLEIMNGGEVMSEGILLSQYGPAMVCIILLLNHIGIVDVYDSGLFAIDGVWM